jgi:hypothetical protein
VKSNKKIKEFFALIFSKNIVNFFFLMPNGSLVRTWPSNILTYIYKYLSSKHKNESQKIEFDVKPYL